MPITGALDDKLSELAVLLSLPPSLPPLPFTPALAFRFSISFLRAARAGEAKKTVRTAVPMAA